MNNRLPKTSFIPQDLRISDELSHTFLRAADCRVSLVGARVIYDGYYSHMTRQQGWDFTVVVEDNRSWKGAIPINNIVVENNNGTYTVNAYNYLLLGRDKPGVSSRTIVEKTMCPLMPAAYLD